jgi:organic radical activating enzyme
MSQDETIICSKMWTDLYINFQEHTVTHCCKQTHYPLYFDEIDSLHSGVFHHNSRHQHDRNVMVTQNKLPASCDFCIKSEPDSIRRVWNEWNNDRIAEIKDTLLTANLTSYIELDIGNKCDMACVYCGPMSSSTWAKELGVTPVEKDEHINEVWRWKIMQALKGHVSSVDKETRLTFNILGGEPLILPDTYKIISELTEIISEANFKNKPQIMITTNLNAKEKLIEKLKSVIEETKDYISWVISISIESIGEHAEKTRYNLNWSRFEHNLQSIKDVPDFIYLTATIDMFSLSFFSEFISWAFESLGHDTYARYWDFTMNSVQDTYSDVTYCPKDQVDIDCIIKTYNKNLEKSGLLAGVKSEQIRTHIQNLGKQLETKTPDDKFWAFWNARCQYRGVDYYNTVPLKSIVERYR